MHKSLSLIAIISLLLQAQLFGQYRITELGTLGGTYSVGNGVNNIGQVVGESGTFNDDYVHAFLWEDGTMLDLGTLGGNYSYARAINDSGTITGDAEVSSNVTRAFKYSNSIMSNLGTLGGNSSYGNDINNAGEVTGGSAPDISGVAHAFRYQGTMSDLGTLGGDYSTGAGMNAAGDVVGQSRIPGVSNNTRAFKYSNGIMTNIGTFDGVHNSAAEDINDSGWVVGLSVTDNGAGPHGHACLWKDSIIIQLEVGALTSSAAEAINNRGEIVGYFSPTPNNPYAVIWQNGVMHDLTSMLPPGSGWSKLKYAHDINDSGAIVGVGVFYGQDRAFLLEPEKNITITVPVENQLFVGGETDTIRWVTERTDSVRILFSLNNGMTYTKIADSIPATAGMYIWNPIPDTVSRKSRIIVEASSNPSVADTTPEFRIKGYILTNVSVTGDYIAYDPAIHRWGFENTDVDVWPATWYERFNYRGTDPYTGYSYSQVQGDGVFAIAKSSDHPDWVSFVSTFGTSACYRNTLLARYSPTALTRWASVKGAWRGSCFGIAISNAIAFRNYSALQSAYPDIPLFTVPIYLTSDSTTIPMVNTLFTHQLGDPHVTYRAKVGILKTPNQTLHDLKTMCLSETAAVRTLSLLNNGSGGGGHAILAYKVKKDPVQPTVYNVYVYDNSWADSTTAHIDIDTTLNGGNGGWSYALWPGWGGSKWLYLRDPALTYLSTPTIPKNNPDDRLSPFLVPDGWLELGTPNGMSISITDSSGNVTGYVDSLMRSDIPGSLPHVVENGSKTAPYGYLFPTSSYSVALTDFATPDVDAFFFVSNVSFRYGRKGAQAQQTDHLRFDGSVTFINHDPEEKEILLETIVNEGPGEKVSRFSQMRVGTGDSLNLLPVANDRIKLAFFGQPKKIRVAFEFVADTGIAEFVRDSLPLNPNTAYTFVPDWLGLGSGGVLTVLVDQGNDGTTDDTLSYSNQATGVDGEIGSTRPERFVLAQNYPNPFNSSTVIEYGLPVGGHVTLKVYDVLGREVHLLVDEFQQPGYRQVRWDASGLPSGVYYVRMTAGAFTELRKILLMR
jgi:probable HAF family extracellular repeat protein